MHQEASAQLEYIGVQQWEMVIHESQHSKSCTINMCLEIRKYNYLGLIMFTFLLKRVIIYVKAK